MRTQINLEDALNDSPQMRALVQLFEEDTGNLRQWCHSMATAIVRLNNAQHELTAATAGLSSLIASYSHQRLPLEESEYEIPIVTSRLSETIGEISSWMDVVGQQMSNCVLQPVRRLVGDLDQIYNDDRMAFHESRDELEEAEDRFAKCGRRETPRKLEEVNNDVFIAKNGFHQSALLYYSRLNSVQYMRYTHVIEPLLGLVYAWRSFFTTGNDGMKMPAVASYLTEAQKQIQLIHADYKEMRSAESQLLESINQCRKLDPDVYYAEPLNQSGDSDQQQTATAASQLTLTEQSVKSLQKQGTLWLRSKSGLFLHSWERTFVFTQGTDLMWQKPDELVGQLLVDVAARPGTMARPDQQTDRRFVFVLAVPSAKAATAKPQEWLFQARNSIDCAEWINVINHLSGHLSQDSSTGSTPEKGNGARTPANTPVSSDPSLESNLPPIHFDLIPNADSPMERHDVTDSENTTSATDPAHTTTYPVHFLGCMEVLTDRGDRLLNETIRRVLLARAENDLGHTVCETLLSIDLNRFEMRLTDPADDRARARFKLVDIAYWTSNPDNDRYVAFIARKAPAADKTSSNKGKTTKFTCYVLETRDGGKEVCTALTEATKKALQELVGRKTSSSQPTQQEHQQISSLTDANQLQLSHEQTDAELPPQEEANSEN